MLFFAERHGLLLCGLICLSAQHCQLYSPLMANICHLVSTRFGEGEEGEHASSSWRTCQHLLLRPHRTPGHVPHVHLTGKMHTHTSTKKMSWHVQLCLCQCLFPSLCLLSVWRRNVFGFSRTPEGISSDLEQTSTCTQTGWTDLDLVWPDAVPCLWTHYLTRVRYLTLSVMSLHELHSADTFLVCVWRQTTTRCRLSLSMGN